MQEIVDSLNAIIWSPALIYLCLGAGLFYSILTRFVQVRHFGEMWRLLFANAESKEGVTSFQALTMSLSGRVAMGNIAGVAAAIGFGGPGAVFWMWVVAFLGAATSYIECTLGQIYKEEIQGEYRGGPAFYFEKVFGHKGFAVVFALATILAAGLLLPGVQANNIGNAVEMAFGAGELIDTSLGHVSLAKVMSATGVILLLGFVILGGVKRIARFTQFVVPFMALSYIIVALVIIGLNLDKIPVVLGMIIGDAFTPMAGFGAAIGWGVKRGVYSNEAGQGTGPHSAAAAEVDHPAQQGLVQAFAVYVDTLFICSATAFMILITGAYNVHGAQEGVFLAQNLPSHLAANSPAFTQFAVEQVFPGAGNIFVALALVFFCFTTILAYYYIAESNVMYLRRSLAWPDLTLVLKLGLMASTFYGAVKEINLAWAMGEVGVGLMAWLNILGILLIFFMGRPAIRALKDYEAQQKAGVVRFRFDPDALGIKNATFWRERLRQNKASDA